MGTHTYHKLLTIPPVTPISIASVTTPRDRHLETRGRSMKRYSPECSREFRIILIYYPINSEKVF